MSNLSGKELPIMAAQNKPHCVHDTN